MSKGPERLAAVARAVQPTLHERLAAASDELVQGLADAHRLVPWEAELIVGRIQRQLRALVDERFVVGGGPPVWVEERREQPLEAIVATWRWLRSGRQVRLSAAHGAGEAGLRFLESLGDVLGEEVLQRDDTLVGDPRGHERVGVEPASERVALVQPDADEELAAYLLGRVCLRRTGFDPRGVHRVVVAGKHETMERHLRRVFVGTRMGPPSDHGAFAGPVDEAQAEAYDETLRIWAARNGVRTIVEGARLQHAGADQAIFLAPSLVKTEGLQHLDAPTDGPLLVLHEVPEDQAESALAELAGDRPRLRLGEAPRGVTPGPEDRQFGGALLLERLPPGLPDPRP